MGGRQRGQGQQIDIERYGIRDCRDEVVAARFGIVEHH